MSTADTFASALSAAMDRRQMTLATLRDGLAERGHRISLTAISYWRSGQRQPERQASRDALPELEAILGLTAGSLTRLLPTAASRRAGMVEAFDQLLGEPALEAVTGESDVRRVTSSLVVDVGAQREILRARVRQLVVAERDGVDGVTLFVGPDTGTDENHAMLRPVAGCTLGEIHDRARGIRGTRIIFDRPLALGESALTEVEAVAEGELDLETDYSLAAEQKMEEVLVWVRFHPDHVPRRCWVFFREGALSHGWPVDIVGGHTVHYRQTEFGPGSIGVRWEW